MEYLDEEIFFWVLSITVLTFGILYFVKCPEKNTDLTVDCGTYLNYSLTRKWYPRGPEIGDEVSCKSIGGKWGGTSEKKYCMVPTPDAGKACTNEWDCEVTCEKLKEDKLENSKLPGECFPFYDKRGSCIEILKNGGLTETICFD